MKKEKAKYCYYERQYVQTQEEIGYKNVLVYTNDIKKLIKYGGLLNKDYKGKFSRKELEDAGLSDMYIDILVNTLNSQRSQDE